MLTCSLKYLYFCKRHPKDNRKSNSIWQPQVYYGIYIFLNKKSHLDTQTKVTLYKVCLQSIMMYASTFWGQASKINIKMIETQQNKIMRSIHNGPWYIRNHNIRAELKIETTTIQISIQNKNKNYRIMNHDVINSSGRKPMCHHLEPETKNIRKITNK